MKILFCGDVVGRSGREMILTHIPRLRKQHALDFVIVNGDNAASGFGITPGICRDFFAAGVDVITGGDHIWDQKDIVPFLAQEKRLLRPHNYPERTPGSGFRVYPLPGGRNIGVLHLLGQVFHKEHLHCPFATADQALSGQRLGHSVQALIVDMHAEATSEKTAMGQYLNGRVSMVVGSHTHIPTADARILSKGTAYQTDAGMCGDYDSVIGFDAAAPLERFLTKISKVKLEAAKGKATLYGTLVTLNPKTGLAEQITTLHVPAG